MLIDIAPLLSHLICELIFNSVGVVCYNFDHYLFIRLDFLIFFLKILYHFSFIVGVHFFQTIQELHIAFTGINQGLAFNSETLCSFVRAENVHSKNLWLTLKYVFVFWKIVKRHNLSHSPAVWTLNAHHIWTPLSSQFSKACLTEGMAALKDSRYLEVLVIWKGTYLTIYSLVHLIICLILLWNILLFFHSFEFLEAFFAFFIMVVDVVARFLITTIIQRSVFHQMCTLLLLSAIKLRGRVHTLFYV